MRIQRLSWAGLAITEGETTVLVDPLTEVSRITTVMGEPREPIYRIEPESAQFALITNLHPDHYVPETLRECLTKDGLVVCHHPLAQKVAQDGFSVLPIQQEVPFRVHGLRITPVPAVDGFGDDQTSWIIEGEEKRIIHCGDTLWHGYWWRMQHQYGPFDLAFLPINGVIMKWPNLIPSQIAASMTPEQAVAAAILLRARAVCPIHYGMFHHEPLYSEHPHAPECLAANAQSRQIPVLWLQPGEEVPWEQW